MEREVLRGKLPSQTAGNGLLVESDRKLPFSLRIRVILDTTFQEEECRISLKEVSNFVEKNCWATPEGIVELLR
jgi:hypothetical protein